MLVTADHGSMKDALRPRPRAEPDSGGSLSLNRVPQQPDRAGPEPLTQDGELSAHEQPGGEHFEPL
jgi:hypothetical protein